MSHLSPVRPSNSTADNGLHSAARLSAHLDNTPLAVIEWSGGTHIARWSGQAERIFGWSAEEVMGKSVLEWRFVHDDDVTLVSERVRVMSEGREHRCVVLNRNYTKDGRTVWCQWHNSLLVDPDAGEHSVLSLVLDVTERKAAEEELIRSEARFRAALSSAHMMGWDWDFAQQRSHFSSNYAEFYGLPPNPDYGDSTSGWLAVHPDDIPVVTEHLRRATEFGIELNFEYRGRVPRADGETRWFVTRGQVLRNPDGTPVRVAAVTTDVTDRKIAERERAALDRQLLNAQKWESLGVLAGGLAHDFNNILTVIMGGAGLARKFVPTDSPAIPLLDQIDDAARRAADLCRQMLAYSGRSYATTGHTDLNRLIREAAPLLEVSAARHARIRYELAPALPTTTADAAQLRQVLVSLVMNAAEALTERGGEVVVCTAVEVIADGDAESFRLLPPPGRYLVLTVSDTGPGMTDDVKSRMFDPFFTTKFAGRGLGLSAALGIVKANGGGIAVQSELGRGSSIRTFWPAGAASSSAEPTDSTALGIHPSDAAPAQPQPRGVVVIVDDELYIRELTAATVEELGYETVLAADAHAGEALLQWQSEVCFAIIDLVMPGRDGKQLLAAIRTMRPELPVIVMSGFAEPQITDPKTHFLQKPFTPEELAAAIARLVGPAR